MFTFLTITLRFLRRQTRTKPYRDLADIVRSYNHRVTFTTSLYKSHDAHTMTLRKSQGVGTLTVQLSCNYVHGFERPSMFIFGFHLNCVSKSCDHKSCNEEASVVVFFVCGRVPWLYQYRTGGFMLFVILCPGTPEGSTDSGSAFKASQKTGQRLKVSSDRLGEAGNRTCDPWFTRHRLIPYTTANMVPRYGTA